MTARCNTPEEGREKCRGMIEQIYKTDVGPYIYGVDESLEEAAVRLMREKGLHYLRRRELHRRSSHKAADRRPRQLRRP